MNVNHTANSFWQLPWHHKLRRIVQEPGKARAAVATQALSLIGQREYQPFLILTRSRTGSNMLVQYLNCHRQISCGYEMLAHLEGRSGPELVRQIYGKQPFYIRARGFKIFYYHPMDADGSSTWKALRAVQNLRLIHLTRRNILETAVSSRLACLTGLYGDIRGHSIRSHIQSDPFIYPADKLQVAFEQTRRWERDTPMQFSHCPQLELIYEDLVADPLAQLSRICSFLSITEPFYPRTSFRKQRTKSLRATLSNYDDLKAHFASSEWAVFFAE